MKTLLTFCLASILTVGFSVEVQAQDPMPKMEILTFDRAPQLNSVYQRSTPDNAYLSRLRTTYQLEKVVAGKKTNFEKVKAVCGWVRQRWEHNGDNTPLKNDPISILEEAATGKSFRCVEYGIVVSGALNALGIPARTLALKMEHADTISYGAGHVVAEAYLKDLKKWVMVDGQFDVIPMLKNTPLNAVELQQALSAGAPDLKVVSFSGTKAADYFPWVAPYLFYFNTVLDNRYGVDRVLGSIMLVPKGYKNLPAFQKNPIQNMVYTHSLADFYPEVK
ncbi:transglutaminase-like domain-containing protein [Rufibacter sp. DG15C]|uniref:transglutaminase-like domain-containing protein n=1 Tax=Rufibacter sp. DG15C TaxID=1379909 RepID=UPI00083004E6|nr:transglutaminase-like domain-containing protein [Rufibacter sp. DG15C]